MEQAVAHKIPGIGSLATLQRCEKATGRLKEERVYALLRFYDAPSVVVREAEALMKQSHGQQWWTHYADVAGEIMNGLFALETHSKMIRTCQQILVPGMLQTANYSRAVMKSFYGSYPNPKEREKELARVERRLEMRLHRQHLLDQPDAPMFEALIAEQAVKKLRGGKIVMREQLRQLYNFAENKPNVHIRILPESATLDDDPVHPAMTLFKPHDSATGRTIYLEDMNRGGTFLAEPNEVEIYQASIDDWWARALSKRETLDCLQKRIDELAPGVDE
ncbi:DUF5753 domain-containing protein [Streptomyces sp. NBC_01431]|uniref:DUF5753 domain-containing protein n=1 Tax=Streptomyces sp. NBC_01431 TaxID=2903863 RepID=UPI002E34DB22|nr:DUF5753 domain-containing protein [Streptomyces sp. NBC_01431]